jgi:hypothetical protein
MNRSGEIILYGAFKLKRKRFSSANVWMFGPREIGLGAFLSETAHLDREGRDECLRVEVKKAEKLLGAGDPADGNDSPLYGAMGFVRKSEKKSGLTRKKKP